MSPSHAKVMKNQGSKEELRFEGFAWHERSSKLNDILKTVSTLKCTPIFAC
jgi:hypothetical protein